MSYLQFAMRQRRFLGFGFLAAFASSFGQTYFIGVFGPSIQSDFGLSHTDWAKIYLYGTLASAMLLPWSGKLIDHKPLGRYTAWVMLFLAVGCGFAASVQNVALLAVAIFMLRQGGQGLLMHISITSMTRYYEEGRGRAIAIATLGLAAGEACLPILALGAITWFGWRQTIGGVGVLVALVFVPCVIWLLRGHGRRHQGYLERLAGAVEVERPQQRSWSTAKVLRDPRFYLLLPGTLAPAFVVTALFFHHLNLADSKGWSHTWITSSYVIYAGASTIVALVCGSIIDRLGALRLVPLMLLPLAAALLVVGLVDDGWIVWPYFILLGTCVGIGHTAVSAMWAELYGVESIGAIKSLVTALAVLASALAPLVMGALMDAGVVIDHVCLLFAGYVLVAFVLLWGSLHTWKVK